MVKEKVTPLQDGTKKTRFLKAAKCKLVFNIETLLKVLFSFELSGHCITCLSCDILSLYFTNHVIQNMVVFSRIICKSRVIPERETGLQKTSFVSMCILALTIFH